MITIDLHNVINSESANRELRICGYKEQDLAFSLDTLKNILKDNQDDQDLTINIHCDGGSVSEGLAIYDTLRTSGKNIYTNIEGSCHSMAVCILLAAPLENRTANANATALIHKVTAPVDGNQSADTFRIIADEIEAEQEKILDIYADRTALDKDTLRTIMAEEKFHNAKELLHMGFIGRINDYTTNCATEGTKTAQRAFLTTSQPTNTENDTTNFNNNPNNNSIMAKETKKTLLNRVQDFINSLMVESVNFDHTDTNGNILFSTEADTDAVEIGMAALPDGTFETQGGKKVTIKDGIITEIEEPQEETEEETATEEEVTETEEENETENLKAQNAELTDKINQLQAQLAEAQNLLVETRNQLQSNYKPAKRATNARECATAAKSVADYKNEVAENRKKLH